MLWPAAAKRREDPAVRVTAAVQLQYAPVVRITPGTNEIAIQSGRSGTAG